MIRWATGIAMVSSSAMLAVGACGNGEFDGAPSTNDAQADAVGDASSASDSASDGGIKLIGDAGRIFPITCVDGGHFLCDTFDEAKVSSDVWMAPSPCSQPFLDTTTSVSAPSSLSTSDVGTTENCASVFALVPSALNAKFSSSFDVLVDSPNTTGFAPFFAIWITTAEYSFYEIALTTNAAGGVSVLENLTYLDDAGAASPVTLISDVTLVANAWNHVDFSADLANSNLVDVAINDGTKRAVLLQHRPTAGSVTAYRVYLGVPNGGLTKAAAHFDDFVCDVTP